MVQLFVALQRKLLLPVSLAYASDISLKLFSAATLSFAFTKSGCSVERTIQSSGDKKYWKTKKQIRAIDNLYQLALVHN